MSQALHGTDAEDFEKPDNVIAIQIDALGGGLPFGDKQTRSEYFIKGTEPSAISPIYQKLKLSKSDESKLANAVEIASGDYIEKDFIVFTEDDPTSKSDENKWQEGIDIWMTAQPDSLYHVPKDESSQNFDRVVVRIKQPEDKVQTDSNTVLVQADAKAVKEIKKLEIYVDDSLKTTVNGERLEETLNLSDGRHKIKVKGYDSEGRSGESEIIIGIKVSAYEPTQKPESSPIPTLIPSP